METALLEKNRINDELKAFDFALEGLTKQKELRGMLRGLKQRLDLAKELGAIGQARLFDRELVRTERAYRIQHENPYPECNKTDAMDAMCEPIAEHKSDIEKVKVSMNERMRETLDKALMDSERVFNLQDSNILRRSFNELQAYRSAFNQRSDAMQFIMNNPWATGYSRKTHKYDLACEVLNLADLKVEGTLDTEVMLPMSALCRMKEAKEKNLFDHFEVWRPAEWKAPDPWLVGVWYDAAERRSLGNAHYYKVCDWR